MRKVVPLSVPGGCRHGCVLPERPPLVAGAPPRRLFLVHLLPNLLGPIIVYATLTVPQAILQESFLSFLGIGVQDPLPSWGNLAAVTLSNGEGCGHAWAGTGIHLNNMLGEEDLHPDGFDAWPTDTRIASMMAPSVLELAGGRQVAFGSGGSNRIRTALLQVASQLVDHGLSAAEAVVVESAMRALREMRECFIVSVSESECE